MAGALIVTAELGREDQAWLDRARRVHFPPERNHLSAHLTMFHALPPTAEGELKRRLAEAARGTRPSARIDGLMNLGRGVAYRIVSDDLDRIRSDLADAFRGGLSAQDAEGWRPHVTIQNKVEPKIARRLFDELSISFRPIPIVIAGLGLHRYLDGPWEEVSLFPFRGT